MSSAHFTLYSFHVQDRMNCFQTFYHHSSTHFAFYLFDNAFVEVFSMFLFQIHNFQNILQTSLLGQRKTKGRFSLLCRYLPSYPPSKFLPVRFPSQHTKYNHVPFRIGKINVQRRGMYALTIFVVRKKKTTITRQNV